MRSGVVSSQRQVTTVRGILLRTPSSGGVNVAEKSWTHDELLDELEGFERELKAAGLRDSSVRTYTDRTRTFLRWLVGDYTPQGPVS